MSVYKTYLVRSLIILFVIIIAVIYIPEFYDDIQGNIHGVKFKKLMVEDGKVNRMSILFLEKGHFNDLDCARIIDSNYLSGICFLLSGDNNKSSGNFLSCSNDNSRMDLCNLFLGDAQYSEGEVSLALDAWSLSSSSLFFLNRTAQALQMNNLELARSFRTIAEEIKRHSSENEFDSSQIIMTSSRVRDIGIQAEERNELDVAEFAYQTALLAHPENSLAAYRLGRIYRQRGDILDSIELLKSASNTEYSSLLKAVYLELGDIYSDRGILDLAVSSYSQALDVDPNYDIAKLKRARIYIELEDWDVASSDLEALIFSKNKTVRNLAQRYIKLLPVTHQ